MPLTLTPLPDVPLITPGVDLVQVARDALKAADLSLIQGDVMVVTQKVVSKAEGRFVDLASVTPSLEAVKLAERSEKDPRLVELILRESAEILRVRPGLIIVEHRLGFICANAGIDHSNTKTMDGEWVLLLPENPDRSATRIREGLEAEFERPLGVMIIDSHGRSWRLGTVGVAIGLSGIPGCVDLRGSPDLFGFELQATEVGAGDELAAAASLMMGQAAEGTPFVHVRGFPYPLRPASMKELLRPKDKDMFR